MSRVWIAPALLIAAARAAALSEGASLLPQDCACEDSLQAAAPAPAPGALLQRFEERLGEGRERVALDLFVMSLCPYAMEAQRTLLPLVARFEGRVALQIHYIADERGARRPAPAPATTSERPGCAAAALQGEGPFLSLHGQEEIDESRRQLVLREDHPGEYLAYLLCRSRQGPQGEWRLCAQGLGLDPERLQAEALGGRGEALLRANIGRANALGIHLSPTLLVDGEPFSGDFGSFDLARRICRSRPGDPRCASIPACGSDADCPTPPGAVALCEHPDTPRARCTAQKAAEFSLAVLTTGACSRCETGDFLRTTLELFPGARVQTYPLEQPAGQTLAAEYGARVFPAYIFSAGFAASPRFERVRHLLRQTGDGYLLAPRLNSVSYWPERPRRAGRLDLFLPPMEAASADSFVALWPGENLRLHLLPGPGPAADAEQVLACVAAHSPARYPAHAAGRLSAADLEEVVHCARTGQGRDLLRAARALADSLELRPDQVAALLENRTLVRRAQASRVIEIWQEGNTP